MKRKTPIFLKLPGIQHKDRKDVEGTKFLVFFSASFAPLRL